MIRTNLIIISKTFFIMEFISIPVTFGIGAYAFYKLVELFCQEKRENHVN